MTTTKSILLSFLCIVLVYFNCKAQDESFIWAKSVGGSQLDETYSVQVDDAGNVYSVGNFHETVDFDPGDGVYELTSSGGYDSFILKLDVNGNFVWAKSLGGTGSEAAFAVALDAAGNVHVTGSYSATIDIDPGDGITNLTSQGYEDGFILKLDNDGNFLWGKTFGGTDQKDIGKSIAVDDNGNVFTTGSFWWIADFDPGPQQFIITPGDAFAMFILKLDANGDFVWAKSMDGSGDSNIDSGHGLALDAAGNVYTVGTFTGTADFNTGLGTLNLSSVTLDYADVYISKLDNDGNFLWAKTFGSEFWDYGYAIALDDTGNIYTAGGHGNVGDFDPGDGVFNLEGYGLFISKLDNDGNFIWAKSMGGSNYTIANSIALDDAANVFITGTYSGTPDFDPSEEVYNMTASDQDIHLCKLDTDGNFIWAKTLGGPNTDNGYDVTVDHANNVYAAGRFKATADFNPDAPVYNLSTAFNYPEAYVMKYGPVESSVLEVMSTASLLSVFPIPAHDQLTINMRSDKSASAYVITNNLGQEIFGGRYNGKSTTIDIGSLLVGIYFVRVGDEVVKFEKD